MLWRSCNLTAFHTMTHWSSGLPVCFPSWETRVQSPGGYLSETGILLLALSCYNVLYMCKIPLLSASLRLQKSESTFFIHVLTYSAWPEEVEIFYCQLEGLRKGILQIWKFQNPCLALCLDYCMEILVSSIPLVYNGNRFLRFLY